jgi:hypothetical protein
MKRLSLRRRVLFGGLALAGVIGAVDRFSGSAGPTSAEAGPAASDGLNAAITPGPDVADLVQRVMSDAYAAVSGELERLGRDVFVPTPTVDALFAALEPAEAAASGEEKGAPSAAAAPPPPTFNSPPRLVGVLLGAVPLAVVNERVLPVGGELDGFRVVTIARDHVVLHHTQSGQQLTLTITAPADKP